MFGGENIFKNIFSPQNTVVKKIFKYFLFNTWSIVDTARKKIHKEISFRKDTTFSKVSNWSWSSYTLISDWHSDQLYSDMVQNYSKY